MIKSIIGWSIAIVSFAIIFAVLTLYVTLSWGTVLWCFWDWFLLPVFPTVGVLTYWKAVGLMFIINLFKNQVFPPQQKLLPELVKDDGKNDQALATIIAPWIILFIGFITQLLLMSVS